jgi:serine palmitoyltransferase
MREQSVLLSVAKYVENQEIQKPRPSIRICVSAGMKNDEIKRAAHQLKKAVDRVVGNHD